ncbi:hypothetical protein GOP47_0028407 [Adiantum capillus-veneris]|nr:hypothetical protein GOP47_0028407 [Adiantum capillus-veneris]
MAVLPSWRFSASPQYGRSMRLQNIWILCALLSGLELMATFMLPYSQATAATPPSTSLAFNYSDALSKSLLFLEVQRSGKLPANQRVTWRGNSGLLDGSDANVDLTGGYYDAGDNVKFGFPMAFTVTVLAWGVLESPAGFESAGELFRVRGAIRWGTDYLLKTSAVRKRLWVQVGEAEADHQCWQRPESMRTPRTAVQINASNPGTEVAAETAAALAAASLVFKGVDAAYSQRLLKRSFMVFRFADRYRASHTGQCPFYCTYSGYKDDLLWAAAWIFKASGLNSYLRYVRKALHSTTSAAEFNWDNKNAGAAVLLVSRFFGGDKTLKVVKARSDYFMCANLAGNNLTQVRRTPGGLLYVRTGANTQYAGGAAFLAAMYADYLVQAGKSSISCDGTRYTPQAIMNLAQSQVDYILGKNPLTMSYMVGFGKGTWPAQVHHRGASIPTAYKLTEEVEQTVACAEGFHLWYARNATNPNEAVGAIVGGPDQHDAFRDLRSNSEQLEPTTYTNALFTGVLARLVPL